MGRGARPTVRWKHDRIRSKKARDKRHAIGRQQSRTAAADTAAPAAPRPA